jgi:hypothetical protein
MSQSISDILAFCLDEVERGELTIDQCIEKYPAYGDELSALLHTSQNIKAASAVNPRPTFSSLSQARMQNLIINISPKSGNNQTSKTIKNRLSKLFFMKNQIAARLVTIMVLIAILIGGSTGAAFAASDALPGDTLYTVKTTFEEVQLVISDDNGDVDLLNAFANERVAEIQSLLEIGRFDDIPNATQAYQNTVAKLAQAMSKLPSGERSDALFTLVETARENRTRTLTSLLDKVPEQAQKGIRQALEAGPPDHAGGPPDDKGKPDNVGGGPPDDRGKPDQQDCTPAGINGQPEGTGNQGQGQGNGNTGNSGKPVRICKPEESE